MNRNWSLSPAAKCWLPAFIHQSQSHPCAAKLQSFGKGWKQAPGRHKLLEATTPHSALSEDLLMLCIFMALGNPLSSLNDSKHLSCFPQIILRRLLPPPHPSSHDGGKLSIRHTHPGFSNQTPTHDTEHTDLPHPSRLHSAH